MIPFLRAHRALALVFAGAVGLGGASGCGQEEPEVATPARPVVVAEVAVRTLEERIESTGELLAKSRAEVAAQVDGEITEVHAEEGDPVAEGDLVLAIDPERRELERDRARARVEEARAAVREQEREVARVRVLAEQEVASETRLDSAETALATARARLAAAEAELGVAERALRDAGVRARFAGVIARRHVQVGEFVAPGQPLFELVSLDPLEVEFDLPEADSARVSVGLPLEVGVSPFPGEVFPAEVTVVSPVIDPRTRTLRVRALIRNEDARLSPGLFARAHLGISRRENVLMVPEESVLQRADGAVVFRVASGSLAERRNVETGAIRGGWVEIRSGLSAGDRVVQRGHTDLIDGSPVVARNPDGSEATDVSSGAGTGGAR